ncbi:MAG: DUF370 domain-containing protein [Calditrichia bacterium]
MEQYPILNIGFNNIVSKNRVIAIVQPDSLPIRKLRKNAEEIGKLIDATQGKRTKAIIVTDSDHVILSAISVETLIQRIQNK